MSNAKISKRLDESYQHVTTTKGTTKQGRKTVVRQWSHIMFFPSGSLVIVTRIVAAEFYELVVHCCCTYKSRLAYDTYAPRKLGRCTIGWQCGCVSLRANDLATIQRIGHCFFFSQIIRINFVVIIYNIVFAAVSGRTTRVIYYIFFIGRWNEKSIPHNITQRVYPYVI